MENTKLKDMYFTREYIETLAGLLSQVTEAFNPECFLAYLEEQGLSNGELKEKMKIVTQGLHKALTLPYTEALQILRRIAPKFSGFDSLVFPDFVGTYGLEEWELSVEALREFTILCSSEFAVRPFLNLDLNRMMAQMLAWAQDEDERVRRLASEGCRPRLPWAPGVPALKKDPSLIIPILELLRNDLSEDVRRSVANNLNDVSRSHPNLVLDLCESWFGESEETDKMIKHALRSMLKAGNTRALRLFGFGDPEAVSITGLSLTPKDPAVGADGEYFFDMHVAGEQALQLRLELKVQYMRKRGKTSQKVFQIREGIFEPGAHTFRRKFSFMDLSTRKHYPGRHVFRIMVNGEEKALLEFELLA